MGFIRHIPGTRPIEPVRHHDKTLGVGVLGLHEGRTLLLSLSTRCSDARPVAGCDLSHEKIEASKNELPALFYTTDYETMLKRRDVDIVAIYTPDAQHGKHIVKAFEAGKHVICTKPLVNSFDDARLILEAGRRTGCRLLVGQSTRFFEPFRRQRAAYERGDLGTLELVDAHYIHRMDWYYDKSPWVAKGTDWVFLGLSHPIDLLRWYLGPIERVGAMASTSALGRERGVVGPDIYIVNAFSQSGALGRAMGHYGCHELPRARNCIELMLYGSDSTSQAQYHDMRYTHLAKDGTEVVEDSLYAGRHYYFNSEVHGMHYGEFANYAEHFARSIIDNTDASPSLEEGVETFCIMEAVRRASREGVPVEVRPLLKQVGL
ncbi:MAG: Gfo/Idh/MocA family oxidoreductase [Phycisphaerales bacterium]